DRIDDTVGFARNLPRWLKGELTQDGVAGMARQLRRKLRRWAARVAPGAKGASAALELPEWYDKPQSLPVAYRARIAASIAAVRTYRPAPAPVGVTVLRARIQRLFPRSVRDLGWGRVALAGVVVREVPGRHENLLRAPQVQQLAESLLEALA